jgi:hypothetical protein
LYFYKEKQKIRKKYKINTNAISQKYKIQKNIRTKNFKNTRYKKKTNPKISKIQNTKKYEFKNEPESQPHVHFEKQEPTCKLNANPPCFIPSFTTVHANPLAQGSIKSRYPNQEYHKI